MSTFLILMGGAYVFALIVQRKLLATHRKWSQIKNSAGLTGAQTARIILNANGMASMPVNAVRGRLNDHYDPRTKEVSLSEDVYGVPSVAAMAVAAHESGHAIQDHVDYKPLEIRTNLIPIARVAARYGIPVVFVGLLLGSNALVQVGVIGYVGAMLLQFLTLPVEFNASKRALEQLQRLQLLNVEETEAARSVLRSAAMTYVAGVASSAVYILYLAMMGIRWLFHKPPMSLPAPLP